MKNQKGEIATAVIIAIAMGSLLLGLVLPKLSPFKMFEKSAGNKKASFTLQKESSTPVLLESKDGKTVALGKKTELFYNTGMDESVPKPTLGERIGSFFFGLTTTSILTIIGGFLFFPIPFAAWGVRKYFGIKQALTNTVKAIRETDPTTYEALKPKLSAAHDKKDKVLIDKIKAEIH